MSDSDRISPVCSFCGKQEPETEIVLSAVQFKICALCVISFEALLGSSEDPAKTADEATSGRRREACSLCGKRIDQVKHLFRGSTSNVCDYCVRLCSEFIDKSSRTPEEWRKLLARTGQSIRDDFVSCSYTRMKIAIAARDSFNRDWRSQLTAAFLYVGAREVNYLFGGESIKTIAWFVFVKWKDESPGETRITHEPIPSLLEQMRKDGVLCGKTVWYSVNAITHKSKLSTP